MRTTVEIPDEVARRLVERRRAKRSRAEISGIVSDAVASCLGTGSTEHPEGALHHETTNAERERRLQAALALAGSISEDAAERMHRHVRELREGW